jgi:spore coat polysaccharide biosynthesis predicted glycosyltransferase SpsG
LATTPAERPVVALRADGDAATGLGHVRRCLALAAALRPAAEVRFFLRGSEPVAAMVEWAGMPCERVPAPLGATLEAVGRLGARALVVDSYDVAGSELAVARASVPVVAVFDDRGGDPPPADIVIDPSPGRGGPTAASGSRYLAGPRFAPLTPEFAAPVRRHVAGREGRVLLVLGAATPCALMARLARAARRAHPGAVLDLVVGPTAEAPEVLATDLAGLPRVEIHRTPRDVRGLMLAADLAVTGGGVTVFELAATGTPAIGVGLAANQRRNLEGMAEAGCLVLAGWVGAAGLDGAVERAVAALAGDRERRASLSRRGRELVDGRGASRVAAALLAAISAREVLP